MEKKFKVKEMHWEGSDLIIESEDGLNFVFEGAYIQDTKYNYDSDAVHVQTFPVDFDEREADD